jgi:hypothetical protein
VKPIKGKQRHREYNHICVIGGPAYNMQVSAMHTDTVAMLNRELTKRHVLVDTWYRGSSMLPSLRHDLLEGCVTRGADYFLSIDSDTYLMPESWRDAAIRLYSWIVQMRETPAIAFCAAPVRMRSGTWNVVDAEGNHLEDFTQADENGVLTSNDCAWIGTGFTLYNCQAYKSWIEDKEPLYMFGYNKAKPEKPWIGEDAYHAMRVVERGLGFVVDTKLKTGHGAPEWKGNV